MCISGGIVCFTINAAQFDDVHNSYRLKCEELVAKIYGSSEKMSRTLPMLVAWKPRTHWRCYSDS